MTIERERTTPSPEEGSIEIESTEERGDLIRKAKNNPDTREEVLVEIGDKAVKEHEGIKRKQERNEEKIERREKKIEKEETTEEEKEKLKKEIRKIKKTQKKIAWKLSVLEKEDLLKSALNSESGSQERKDLAQEIIKREELLREKREKLKEELKEEQRKIITPERGENITRIEGEIIRINKEINGKEFLTLLEFEKKEQERKMKEFAEKLKEEISDGEKYVKMRDKKGKFTGQRLNMTKEQVERAKKEMMDDTRWERTKKKLLSIFDAISSLIEGGAGLLWEGIKAWAGASSGKKEKKKKD
jgi:putative ABC transport system permease protein